MSRILRSTCAALIMAVVLCLATTAASAQERDSSGGADTGEVTIEGSVDGRPVAGAGSNDPVAIHPFRRTQVELTVNNGTDAMVGISRARLFGRAFGVTFVAYDALVDVSVPAHGSTVIEVPVEFVDLDRQATGLLPGGLAVYGEGRETLAEELFVIDVRGSATSTLGLLGIFVVIATLFGVVGIVVAIQKGTLGPSRIRRALRFGAAGLGAGIAAVMALAVFRVLAPTGTVWIPLTMIPTVASALLGYVSPGPLRLDDEDVRSDGLDGEDSHRSVPEPLLSAVAQPAGAAAVPPSTSPPEPPPPFVRPADRPTQA